MSREEIASKLADAGRRRAEAMEARDEIAREIADLVVEAQRAEFGVTEIARLTGMSRRSIYDLLDGR